MTRAAEMEFGFSDMFRAMIRHWVLIVVIGIVCGIIGGALGYVRLSGGQTQDTGTTSYEEEVARYEKNIGLSEKAKENTDEVLVDMKEEWLAATELYKKHPLMKLDVQNCDWETVSLHFGAQSGHHSGTVHDWIANADEAALFGDAADELSIYKNDIIHVIDYSGETQVYCIGVEGWDLKAAVDYIKDYLVNEAGSAGVELTSVTSSHSSGFCLEASRFQVDLAYRVTSMQNYISTTANSSTAFYVPGAPVNPDEGVSTKSILKYVIVGLLAGLIIGAAFVIIRAVRQGRITGRKQVEEIFDLELLSDLRKDAETALAILDANLDVMVGKDSSVVILDSAGTDGFSERVAGWTAGVDHELIAGSDLFEDSQTIESLNGAAGIVIGIREDVSLLTDVQRLMLRAAKLDKPVLGYVEI